MGEELKTQSESQAEQANYNNIYSNSGSEVETSQQQSNITNVDSQQVQPQVQQTQQPQQVQQTEPSKENTLLGEDNTQQIPEKYEFKGAEGEVISELDVQAYSNVAKELGLSQEQAQKFFDISRKEITETLVQKVKTQSDLWYKEVLNDPEIGGAKFETTKQNIGKVMAKFGNSELRALFDSSGMGNNPIILKFINKIGEAIGEDNNFINGNTPAREPTKEEILKSVYSNS